MSHIRIPDEGESCPGYYFDAQEAEKATRFFERLLHHSKGEWAGTPFLLEPWQRRIIRALFGWRRRDDGTRRYRRAYIEIPRKNGKSTLAAGIALYLLFADGEPGAEIYSAAADRDQAAIVFGEAQRMVEASPALDRMAEIYKRAIYVPSTHSVYRVLSADAYTKHGLNAHGVIFDELHAQPTRELWDTLTTAVGSRRQPLIIALTTAGWDHNSICWEEHEYARQVAEGIIEDDALLPIIYAADPDDDWRSEATWAKANPNLGISVKLDYLRQEARRAELSPAYLNTFLRLHLNIWTQQESRWIPMDAWDACAEPPINPRMLEGQICYGGLDLASTSDIAALVLDFPPEDGEEGGRHIWLPFFWIPEENLMERARRDRVPYDLWLRQGLLRATPGNAIDYEAIIRDIEELAERYRIAEIAFDRWGAFQISNRLQAMGLTMIAFGQGYRSMSPPAKELLRLILDGRLAHGGHPILRWMADNVVVVQDAAGNIKPDKRKSRERIDGIVAGIMALDRAMRHGGRQPSVYERRGLRTL